MTTQRTFTNTPTRNRRFSHLALALALSAGTIGGMISLTSLTSPAFAQAAGGNGGNGGGGSPGGNGPGGNGGEPGNVMNPDAINIAGMPNNPPRGRGRPQRTPPAIVENPRCQGASDGRELSRCRYTQRFAYRIVNMRGFANCALVEQVRGPYGQSGKFYCVQAM